MLGLADASGFVKGVVGWVDFENPKGARTLKRLKGHPKFNVVRPMIQDIFDDEWMLRPNIPDHRSEPRLDACNPM